MEAVNMSVYQNLWHQVYDPIATTWQKLVIVMNSITNKEQKTAV